MAPRGRVQRRVGGYNLDALLPGRNDLNLAHILVGSEGTLAFTQKVELKLSPVLARRAVGACHFGSFHAAMNAAQHIVRLKPIAVELVDRTMIELARTLHLECIAEGVETNAQRQTLRTLGCATGQGYLWAAPLSTTAFLAHVQAAA